MVVQRSVTARNFVTRINHHKNGILHVAPCDRILKQQKTDNTYKNNEMNNG